MSAGKTTQARQDTTDRTAKALTEPLALDPYGGPEHRVIVDSRGKTQYEVDPETPTCDCPDMLHRRPDGACKHVRFARMALGLDPLPPWAAGVTINQNVRDWRDRDVRGWDDA